MIRASLALVTSFFASTVSPSSAHASDDFAGAMKEGQAAMVRAQYPEAMTAFERAVQLNPKSASAHVSLANALMKGIPPATTLPAHQEKLRRAEKEEQAALQIEPNNAEALAGLGELQYRLGLAAGDPLEKSWGIEAAKKTLNRALAADPKNYHAHCELAHLAGAEFDQQTIEAMENQGIKPDHRREYPPELKKSLQKTGPPILDDGMKHAAAAIALKENAWEAMHEMAGLHYIKASIAQSEAAAQVETKASSDWQWKSETAFARLQRAAAAGPARPAGEIRNFEEAVAAGRKSTAAFEYEAAVHAFEKAVQFDPKSSKAHLELARALIRTSIGSSAAYPYDPQRLQQGLKEAQKVLQMSPNHAEAQAWIGSASYAFDSRKPPPINRFTNARDWATHALESDPKNFHANYLLAFLADQEAGTALYEASSTAHQRGVRESKLPDDLREPLVSRFAPTVDAGIKNAQAALEVQPESYLAMSELSNLYFLRSRLSPVPGQADLQAANQWRKKAFELTPKEDPEGSAIRSMQLMPLLPATPRVQTPAPAVPSPTPATTPEGKR